MRVDESYQARFCMRVFSTLMSWSNENKSCMRVDESWQARVSMTVFLKLSCPGQTYTSMGVDKSSQARVCMRVFLILMSWSNEDKSSVRVYESWQARVCINVFSTLLFQIICVLFLIYLYFQNAFGKCVKQHWNCRLDLNNKLPPTFEI